MSTTDIIQITIESKRATVVGLPLIVCGNSDYTVEFTFDEEWAEETERTARFVFNKNGEMEHIDVAFTGNTVAVPRLEGIKSVYIGAYAGDRLTSTPAQVPCELSIRCGTSS